MPPPELACCCCDFDDDEHDFERKAPEEAGPLADASRRCTDVFWLVLLLASWFSLTMLGFVVIGWIESESLPKGDPRRLVYGLDYSGNICGVEGRAKSREKAYFLPSGAIVCVDDCPGSTDYDRYVCEYETQDALDALLEKRDVDGYYEAGTQAVLDYRCNYEWATTEFINYCIFDETPDFVEAASESGPPALPTMAPTPVVEGWTPAPTSKPTETPTASGGTRAPTFNASVPCTQKLDSDYCDSLVGVNATDREFYCYQVFCPDCALPGACDYACDFCESPAPTAVPEIAQASRGDSKELFEEIISDLVVSYAPILIYGFGVASAAGFAWLAVLQIPCFLPVLIWTILASIFATLFAAGVVSAQTAHEWEREDPRVRTNNEIKAAKAFSACLIIGAFLYGCLLVALRKRIVLACGIIKEAARAFGHMPMLALTPILQCAGQVCFFLVWVVYALYLGSSGEIENATYEYNGVTVSYKEVSYSRKQNMAALYLVFCWFWTSEFIEALGDLVVCVAVVKWYFSRDKTKAVLCTPPSYLALVAVVFKRHAGTAACGALIIAIARTIQAVIAYVKRFTSANKSKLAKIVLSCLECCAGCVERCVRFLNKHAYVETAIHGIGFCAAGRRAFTLLVENGFRVAACSLVSSFVLGLGTLAVAVLTTVAFYGHLQQHYDDKLHSFAAPTLVVFVMALAAVKVFAGVFEQTITCVLHCFVVDEKDYADDPFADGALKDTILSTHDRAQGRLGFSVPRLLRAPPKVHLREQFERYDVDHSGKISAKELEMLLHQSTGAKPSDDELQRMIQSIDKDSDGEISYKEFVAIHDRAVAGEVEFKALADAMLAFDHLTAQLDDDRPSEVRAATLASSRLPGGDQHHDDDSSDDDEAILPPKYQRR